MSSQIDWARRIGPGFIARMIERARSSSFRGMLAVASWTSWESLSRVRRSHTHRFWWLRRLIFDVSVHICHLVRWRLGVLLF